MEDGTAVLTGEDTAGEDTAVCPSAKTGELEKILDGVTNTTGAQENLL